MRNHWVFFFLDLNVVRSCRVRRDSRKKHFLLCKTIKLEVYIMLFWLIISIALAGGALLVGTLLWVALNVIYALCIKVESIYRERKGKA